MDHEQQIIEEAKVDTSETWLREAYPEAFRKLLIDHTTHKNIIWATDSYKDREGAYSFYDEITPELITGVNGNVIQPRSQKAADEQQRRVKDKAEVFTPAWICNAQNNLIDEAWFGYPNAFNEERTLDDGTHTWIPTEGKIQFPEGKTWRDYVRDMRLEITCGEAPYLVSRYDAVTGKKHQHPDKGENTSEQDELKKEEALDQKDLMMRVGLLDRKLRVVSENTETSGEWLKWAKTALENTYGYEWQGDSLLLAREAVFMTVLEYYRVKFGKEIPEGSVEGLAYIISWNLWQMDGLKYVIPGSCEQAQKTKNVEYQFSLDFDGQDTNEEVIECLACKTGKGSHIGVYAKIRDWKAFHDANRKNDKSKTDIEFRHVVTQSQNRN